MSLTFSAEFSVYQSWDLTPPKAPPRSRLYHLKPIGVGTPRTESCTGYIARLAKEHCVSVHSLFSRELGSAANNSNLFGAESKSIDRSAYGTLLNGRCRTARDWVEVLEGVTLRREIRFLTMLTWQNVLTDKGLTRAFHAWCPRCLEEQNGSEGSVYEHLLWALDTVKVCPYHKRRLETVCPHCRRQVPTLAHRSRPGHCCRCLGWLGHSQSKREIDVAPLNADELKYQMWIANQMGRLIAVAPELQSEPPRERVTNFIRICKHATGGNINDFARLAGVHEETAYKWLHGKHIPTTDALLKVCYRFESSFSDLLINPSPAHTPKKRLWLPHKNGEVNRLLLMALEEYPPPSVREAARRLGYKHTTSLSTRYPALCKMLTARHRQSRRHRHRTQPSSRLRHDAATIERALRQALEESVPPSLMEIGRRLGYSSEIPLRRFPSLCRAIVSRRRRPPLKPALQQVLKEERCRARSTRSPKTSGINPQALSARGFPISARQ